MTLINPPRCASISPAGDRCLYDADATSIVGAWGGARPYKPPPLTTTPELTRAIAQSVWDTCEERDELKRENAVLHRRLCEHEAAMDEIRLACRETLRNAAPTSALYKFADAVLDEVRSVG